MTMINCCDANGNCTIPNDGYAGICKFCDNKNGWCDWEGETFTRVEYGRESKWFRCTNPVANEEARTK